MNQIEKNVTDSFRLAKSDIIKIQNDIFVLSQSQVKLVELLDESATKQLRLQQKIREMELKALPKSVRSENTFVAPKNGKNFHLENCPFAQNIKPKNKRAFTEKEEALNAGYKACKCLY